VTAPALPAPWRAALALSLGLVASAEAQEAPFGLRWGPVDTVPKPSMVDREANITALIYLRGRAPATGPDTDEIVLEVCRDEGLQQVIWLSRPLAEAEMPSRHEAIRREGVRRYGAPGTDDGAGTLTWPAGRALLTIRGEASGGRRLMMVARGDSYDACSDTHQALAGHPAGTHVTKLLSPGDP
jgi:hypothetical protein